MKDILIITAVSIALLWTGSAIWAILSPYVIVIMIAVVISLVIYLTRPNHTGKGGYWGSQSYTPSNPRPLDPDVEIWDDIQYGDAITHTIYELNLRRQGKGSNGKWTAHVQGWRLERDPDLADQVKAIRSRPQFNMHVVEDAPTRGYHPVNYNGKQYHPTKRAILKGGKVSWL